MGSSRGRPHRWADGERAEGLGEEVALPDVAAEAGEQIRCDHVLHTFRDDLESQVVTEVDPGAHERPAAIVQAEGSDRLTIQLDFIQRQLTQAPDREIAPTEVVDR